MPRIARNSVITAVIVAGLAATLYLATPAILYRPLVALNRATAGLSEHTIEVDRHRLHYLVGGSGETVILLHGIFSEKDHWVDFARYLVPHYRVIIPDLPGFGDSTRREDASYAYPAQVQRLADFMDALGVPRAHFAGNSMGGAIAILFAHDHPGRVSSMALIGGPHGIRSPDTTGTMKRIEAGEIPLIARTPEQFEHILNTIFEKRPFLPRPIYVVARDNAIRNAESNVRLWNDSWRNGYFTPEFLSQIQAPVLAIWGAKDKVFDVSGTRTLKAGIKQCQAHIAEGVGHMPMMEQPRQSAGLYLSFLKEQSKSDVP